MHRNQKSHQDVYDPLNDKVTNFKTKSCTQRDLLAPESAITRSSPPEVSLGKVVLKICIKFTEEHPCQSVISIKLQSNFIEITLRHGYSPESLLHIFRTPFYKNTPEGLLLSNCERNLANCGSSYSGTFLRSFNDENFSAYSNFATGNLDNHFISIAGPTA